MESRKMLESLLRLREVIQNITPENQETLFIRTENSNGWFTENFISQSLQGLADMLEVEVLKKTIDKYHTSNRKNIGLILAGNIPAVGFQDILYVLITNSVAFIKPSSKDEFLIKFLCEQLIQINGAFSEQIKFVEKLSLNELDAIVATGSNNTSRYFKQYFSKLPNVIRQNRTSVAVLNGRESEDELTALATDITQYFGLGCRNVTKLFTPVGYNFSPFLKIIEEKFKAVSFHSKYHNNYDYYKAIYLVERMEHLDNGIVLVREDKEYFSPISVLNYESYSSIKDVKDSINEHADKIQVVVGSEKVFDRQVSFGKAQSPGFLDFPDGENILEFIKSL